MASVHNVIIIGSGGAAHTAALYLARGGHAPVLLSGDSSLSIAPGGLLATTRYARPLRAAAVRCVCMYV